MALWFWLDNIINSKTMCFSVWMPFLKKFHKKARQKIAEHKKLNNPRKLFFNYFIDELILICRNMYKINPRTKLICINHIFINGCIN